MTTATRSAAPGATTLPTGVRRYGGLLTTYLRPQRGRVALLAVLLLGSIGLELAGPLILRRFIDDAREGVGGEALAIMAVLFIGVALADQVLVGLTTYVGENVGWTATNALRADLARHCLELDLSFHDRHTPGELIERIDGDITALSEFFSTFVLYVLWGVLLTVGILVLLGREDWRVGIALAAFCALALGVLQRVRNLATPAWSEDRESSAQVFGFLEERLGGLVDLHANGAQPYVLRRFHELARVRFRRARRAMLLGAVTLNITNGLFVLGYVLAFALGATLFGAGAITIGTVYLIFHYTAMLRMPLEQITQQVQTFQKAAAGIARVDALFHTPRGIPDPPPRAALTLPDGALSVAFESVSFRYGEGQDLVVRDASFSLASGRTLGVLGRTGSGKTTIARLLFRFYDPLSGTIRLGGVDTRRIPQAALQQRIGLVTQEVQLFRATVRDNLTLFDPGVPDHRLRDVIAHLGLGDWYGSLPAGLDTPIAGSGGLSAGEAQLLALTRVFLKEPGIVVLDEASSRLDPATERLLEGAIDRLLAGRTAIIIAHRLGTVQRADDILVLEGGRVVEHGPRTQLAAHPASRFATLLRTGHLDEVLA